MRCYYCETEISETTEFCPVCGGRQINYEPPLQPAGPDTEVTGDIQLPDDAPAGIAVPVPAEAQTMQHPLIRPPERGKGLRIGIIAAAALFAVAALAAMLLYFVPASMYDKGMQLFDDGEYTAASEIFSRISMFSNAEEMIFECNYQNAHILLESGNYDEAINLFREIILYKDSEEMLSEAYYQYALHLMEGSHYGQAQEMLSQIHPYKDTEELYSEIRLQQARDFLNVKNYAQAEELLLQIHPYKDSEELLSEAGYLHAQQLIAAGGFFEAKKILESMPGYKNSSALIVEIDYLVALEFKDSNRFPEALEAFGRLGTYRDSREQIGKVTHLIYLSGIESYRMGDYSSAASWFDYTSGYEDTDKYLTMMEARDDETTENGMALLEFLDFEDAGDIIAGSDYYLSRFLGRNGDWELSGNWYNDYGSYIIYNRRANTVESDNLPFRDGTYYFYTFEDGIHYQHTRRYEDKEKWEPFWEFSVVSIDEISVHNLYDNLRYTLYRHEGTVQQLRESLKMMQPRTDSQTKGTMEEYGELGFAYPVPSRFVTCGSPYGSRFSGTDFHGGIDITVPIGTPLYAPEDGYIAGKYIQFGPGGGAGYYMTIELDVPDPKSGLNLMATYMHMEKPSMHKEGDRVRKGQLVGYSGNTGFTSNARYADGTRREYAAHLHIQFSNNGTLGSKIPSIMINPAWFYPDVEFKDGTQRGLRRERFLEVLYTDSFFGYPNRAAGS